MADRVVREKLATTIVRDDYLPALIALIANDLLWTGTRIYHQRFGIHTNEWRVLSALGNCPGANAKEVCDVLGMNKSVVSRSAAVLRNADLVVMEKEDGVQRLYLTEAGAAVHDEILPIAIGLHQELMAGFTDREQRQLKKYLCRLLANSEKLQRYESEQTHADDL
ncbi:MarR family winged helix-turn-helix transcriptional regulator [Saccharomonospora sp. NPDC046836]|uniref:MarR family winged helix-turn-helix transcriptional regulator n=1 Tax=Saccharomonospora sp. NPDC046836 TaxID=3156921 RepID=UPI0033E36EF7